MKPINKGIDEQKQNGVTVPNKVATIFAPTPWERPKIYLLLSEEKIALDI